MCLQTFRFAWKAHSKVVRFGLRLLSFEVCLPSLPPPPQTCFSSFLAFCSSAVFYLWNAASCMNKRRVLCNNFFLYCFDSWGLLGQRDTKKAKQWNALSCLHCSQLQRLLRLNGLVSSVPLPPRTNAARGRRVSNKKRRGFFFPLKTKHLTLFHLVLQSCLNLF